VFLNFWITLLKLHHFSKWPPEQAVKEDLQCTSKYGQLRISLDIFHVRRTDIEGFLTTYGHSDNLLNNNGGYYSTNCHYAHIWSGSPQYLSSVHDRYPAIYVDDHIWKCTAGLVWVAILKSEKVLAVFSKNLKTP